MTPEMSKRDIWSAAQYLKFNTERTRAARDLLARVPLRAPRRIVDLGCGPGNSTSVLAGKYPNAHLSGIDSSSDMIRKAREVLPGLSFEIAELETFEPNKSGEPPVDLFFSNAVMQWLPGPRRLPIISKLLQQLSAGGVLAIQVPDNLSEPCHAAMREVAFTPGTPWEDALRRVSPVRDEFPSPSEIYDTLLPFSSSIDIWGSTYFHVLESHEAIVEWLKGTGLRPFLNPLTTQERDQFLSTYLARLKVLYSSQLDGKVLLPYPRRFVVAIKKDD